MSENELRTVLEAIMGRVDAFKKDMESLGVEIYVGVKEVEPSLGAPMRGLLCILVREDLEPELGNPHQRLEPWVKPPEEDLEAEG